MVLKQNTTAYTIQTPFEGNFMRMADKLQGNVTKDAVQPLMMRSYIVAKCVLYSRSCGKE
jgi:hypothetical protein